MKIVRDWRTGKSKGYGFAQFYEPLEATTTIEGINGAPGRGWQIRGRRLRLDQGTRKPSAKEEERARKREARRRAREEEGGLDAEGRAIYGALEEAGGGGGGGAVAADRAVAAADEDGEEEGGMSEDDMITFLEKGGLREVMPLTEETASLLGLEGRYEDDDEGLDEIDHFQEYYDEHGYQDADFEDEGEGGDEDEDDGELVYDGVFEEEYDPAKFEGLGAAGEEEEKRMNREQRRAAERKRKKRKLPFRGFGKLG